LKIEHIAIYVKDLESSRNFFQQFFGGISNDGYHNPNTGLRTYFLTFEDGARLELMNRPDMATNEKMTIQTGYAHLAFCVGSREKVDELTEKLRNSGYQVISGPRTTGDGYYESCVLDGENNQIEITI